MQNLHCPPIMAKWDYLKSPSSFWGSNRLSSASSSLLQSTLTIWRRTETAYVLPIDGWARIFVKAAAIVACVGVAMVEAQGYGGGPGSSTSSAEWLCPASLLVSLVAFSTAFLHLWLIKTIIFPVGICRHLMGHVAVVQSGCVMNLRKQSVYRIQSDRGMWVREGDEFVTDGRAKRRWMDITWWIRMAMDLFYGLQ